MAEELTGSGESKGGLDYDRDRGNGKKYNGKNC